MNASSYLSLALLMASVCADASALGAFEARFSVSRNDKLLGTMNMQLSSPKSGDWVFVSHTEGQKGMAGFLGVSIVETSRLTQAPEGLTTLGYDYQQDMVARHRRRSLSVSADGSVVENEGGKRWNYSLIRPAFDRHAVVLGIAERLANKVELGSVFDLPVAGKGKVESWRFLVVGEEQIDTGAGKIAAIRVERMRDNAERKTTSWHARSMDYLPVKVEQTEPDGQRLSSVLQNYVPKTGR